MNAADNESKQQKQSKAVKKGSKSSTVDNVNA